jgi:ABC-type Co2+ transport system permease subunit
MMQPTPTTRRRPTTQILVAWAVLPIAGVVVIAEAQRHAVESQWVGFAVAAAAFCAALVILHPSRVRSLIHGASSAAAWVAGFAAYYSYMNHPWFAGPETNSCDGECFGWYGFENPPAYTPILMLAAAGLATGSLVRWLARAHFAHLAARARSDEKGN